MDDIFRYRKNAKLDGLCDDWDKMWAACHNDKEKLIRLAMMQQSFPHFVTYCYNGRGVSKEYLLREFSNFINGKIFHGCDNVDGFSYSMYVNCTEDIATNVDVSYILWTTDVDVIVSLTKCPSYFVGCSSNIHFGLEGYNSTRIYLYDNSKVTIDYCDEESDVTIFKYSEDAEVEIGKYCLGKVREFNKDLRLQL